MLKGQNPSRESIICHTSQESDFGALREARQIRDEGQTGGDRTTIHRGDIRCVAVLSNEHPFCHSSMHIRVYGSLQLCPSNLGNAAVKLTSVSQESSHGILIHDFNVFRSL